jgi:uncharacterized protein YcbX
MEISEVWRFPVKSMLGQRLERVAVTATGVLGDRAWAIVDAEDGKVASAKNPRKWRALLACRAEFLDEPTEAAPAPDVRITFPDDVTVTSADANVDDRLSEYLGRPVRLTNSVPDAPIFEETWPDVEGIAPTDIIESTRARFDDGESVSDLSLAMAAPGSFLDLAPVHLVTTASLAEFGRLQPESEFAVTRFRPNFVIDGADGGFAENEWVGSDVRLGAATVNIMMPTMRCVMTTLAQGDLPEDRGVLRAASTHNRLEITGLGKWACVGAYAGVVTPGHVAVGDSVAV